MLRLLLAQEPDTIGDSSDFTVTPELLDRALETLYAGIGTASPAFSDPATRAMERFWHDWRILRGLQQAARHHGHLICAWSN